MNSYYTTANGEQVEMFPTINNYFTDSEKQAVLRRPLAFVPNKMKGIVSDISTNFVYDEKYADPAMFMLKLMLIDNNGEVQEFEFQTCPNIISRYSSEAAEADFYHGISNSIEILIRELNTAFKDYFDTVNH